MSFLIKRISKRILQSPIFLLYYFIEAIVTILLFPKYLYYRLKKHKCIAFDWKDGLYADYYLPIAILLRKHHITPLFFWNFGRINRFNFNVFRHGFPRLYKNLIDNKIVISATTSIYKKLNNTLRVQIFHGLGFTGAKDGGKAFIEPFDILFLHTQCQRNQLKSEYQELVIGKTMFDIGCPKIDNYISIQSRHYNDKITTIFYGPTYHFEISSIFDYLETIVNICKINNYRLFIKLHPFLYVKQDFDRSGGIDWLVTLNQYKKQYKKLIIVEQNISPEGLRKYFQMTDIFLTDCSGIGYEFVLATSNPIIFLGDKLKIPIHDLRMGNIYKYTQYPEVYYRGEIGPIVLDPNLLEEEIKKLIRYNEYKGDIEEFKREYMFNLGNATKIAIKTLLQLYRDL